MRDLREQAAPTDVVEESEVHTPEELEILDEFLRRPNPRPRTDMGIARRLVVEQQVEEASQPIWEDSDGPRETSAIGQGQTQSTVQTTSATPRRRKIVQEDFDTSWTRTMR